MTHNITYNNLLTLLTLLTYYAYTHIRMYRFRYTHLESRTHVVEFLEDLRSSLEPHRCEYEDFHVALGR